MGLGMGWNVCLAPCRVGRVRDFRRVMPVATAHQQLEPRMARRLQIRHDAETLAVFARVGVWRFAEFDDEVFSHSVIELCGSRPGSDARAQSSNSTASSNNSCGSMVSSG